MTGFHISLTTHTPSVTTRDLVRLAPALEQSSARCASIWGLSPPAVDVIGPNARPPDGSFPIVFLDDSTDPTLLAVHYYDPIRRGPAARVFVDRASGFNDGSMSVTESASHELVELMVDPGVDLWVQAPGRADGIEVALENADPVQTHYPFRVGGTDWRMANFVTPHWFRRDLAEGNAADEFLRLGGVFDLSNELTRAGEIGPDGYLILRERRGQRWRRYTTRSNGDAVDMSASKLHPWSRTSRRGIGDDQCN